MKNYESMGNAYTWYLWTYITLNDDDIRYRTQMIRIMD